jgi:hypothetical protein
MLEKPYKLIIAVLITNIILWGSIIFAASVAIKWIIS